MKKYLLKNLKMGVILITSKRIKRKDTAASDKATHLVARDVAIGTVSKRIKGKDLKETVGS